MTLNFSFQGRLQHLLGRRIALNPKDVLNFGLPRFFHVQVLDHRVDVDHPVAGGLQLGGAVCQKNRVLQKLVAAVFDDPVLGPGPVSLTRPRWIDDQYVH